MAEYEICSETSVSDSFLEEEEGRGSVDDDEDGKMSANQALWILTTHAFFL